MTNGKSKGSSFERDVCKALSRWVSAGEQEDIFWRSAMSGGRATVGRKTGKDLRRQAGDITAVAPEGHSLTEKYYIECKFYANLDITAFILKGKGKLGEFWRVCVAEAEHYGKDPLLIAKQNNQPIIVLLKPPMRSIPRWHRAVSYSSGWNMLLFEELIGRPFYL